MKFAYKLTVSFSILILIFISYAALTYSELSEIESLKIGDKGFRATKLTGFHNILHSLEHKISFGLLNENLTLSLVSYDVRNLNAIVNNLKLTSSSSEDTLVLERIQDSIKKLESELATSNATSQPDYQKLAGELEEIEELAFELSVLINRELRASLVTQRKIIDDFLLFTGISLFLVFITILVMSYYITTSATRPLKQLKEATNKIEKGNYDIEVDIKSNDEFELLGNSFENMSKHIKQSHDKLTQQNIKLKELDKEKDEFISIAAHELKTPLTSIKGFAQVMKKDEIMDNRKLMKHYLELVNSNTARLYNLIVDLVDSSRLSLGKLKIEIKEVDPYSILKEIRENMTLVMKQKELKLVSSIEKELPKIKADSARLNQIIKNLLVNAIHFSSSGKEISLKAYKKGNFVQFEVKDEGEGIPKDKQKHLFERFYQADASLTRKIKGSGLGLSVSKGLVEMMKGKIWFESEEGKGSTFYFTIPAKGGKQNGVKRK